MLGRPRRIALIAVTTALLALTSALWGSTTASATATIPSSVRTDATTLTIESFTADFHLSRDADGAALLRTVETIVAHFPDFDQNRGIERDIPLRYDDVDLESEIVSVTDDDGQALRYTRSEANGRVTLRIGDPQRYVHGLHTYVITYTQRDVVRSFDDTGADEFYWDVNGTDWDMPFGSVEARVHLGAGLSALLTGQQACYAGVHGANTIDCTISRSGDTITASAVGLASRENLTFAIGFEPGTFAEPTLAKDDWLFSVAPWLLYGGMAIAVLWIFAIRYRLWRDHPGRGIIVPQYSPPKEMYPALAAELLKRPATAFAAQVVNFAVHRVVRLRVFPADPKSRRYELEVLSDDTAALLDQEVTLLKAIMGDLKVRSVRRLDTRDRKLGDRLAKLAGQERKQVQKLGLRARPSRLPALPVIGLAAALIALSNIVANMATERYVDVAFVNRLPFFSVAVFILILIRSSPPFRLTEEGAATRDHLRGMRDYLALAEADRIRVLQSPGTAERIDVTDRSAVLKLYERLLPYAIVLGVDRQWVAELDREYATTQSPDWYAGGGAAASIASIASIHLLTTVSTNTFATTPPPSSSRSSGSWTSGGGSFSGGSSGGGSSGGGGGGGGGRGW